MPAMAAPRTSASAAEGKVNPESLSASNHMSRVNLKTHQLLIPERHVLPKFDPVDTIRLHGMGVKFSETLMIEVSKKEGLQKSSCPPACMSSPA